jgi:hypothetical protein
MPVLTPTQNLPSGKVVAVEKCAHLYPRRRRTDDFSARLGDSRTNRLLEHRCCSQIAVWIHRRSAQPYFIVQVRAGGAARTADLTDRLAAAHIS